MKTPSSRYLGIFVIFFIFPLLLAACNPEKLPNVVFILVDDLGWTDLACYGSDFYDTPNLDALASKSVIFTHIYAASPGIRWILPSKKACYARQWVDTMEAFRH